MPKTLGHVSREMEFGSTFINPVSAFGTGKESGRYKVSNWHITYGGLPESREVFLALEVNKEVVDAFSNENKAKFYNGVHYSHGKVLLSGLGLGYLVLSLAKRTCVTAIDVYEPDEKLWKFVWPLWSEIVLEEEVGKIRVIHDEKKLDSDYDWIICRTWKWFQDCENLVAESGGCIFHENMVKKPVFFTDEDWYNGK